MIGVLCWTYVAVARRVARGVAIPSILMLATIGMSVRTIIGLVSGSTFAYFVQPIATTVVLAGGVRRIRDDRTTRDRHASHPTSATSHPEITDRPVSCVSSAGLTLAVGRRAHRDVGGDVRDAGQPSDRDLCAAQDGRVPQHHGRGDRRHGVVLDPTARPRISCSRPPPSESGDAESAALSRRRRRGCAG